MSLRSYRLLQTVFKPFIDGYLGYRKIQGKEDLERFPERRGKASIARPSGPLLWAHAASIGEAVSVIPLLKAITEKYPNINVLVTTGTVTSANLLQKKLPKKMIHQFVPVDMVPYVQSFLEHWRPDIALWVESELWPNLICKTSSTGCPIILVNARMSLASLEKWQRYKTLASEIFGCFSLCLAQSETEAERFNSAGITETFNAGNLKYESPPLPSDPEETARMIIAVGDRPVWLAASTSEGEEEIAIEIHSNLKQQFPGLLTIIVPRHPERSGQIAQLALSGDVNIAVRSNNEPIQPETDIYLADTIGELGIFYRLASVVFMGGSLVEHGGQNPLEAARLNCAILSGDNVRNFKDIYANMSDINAVIMVKDKNELQQNIAMLLADTVKMEEYSRHARNFVQGKSGIIDNYLKFLEPYLKPYARNSYESL